MKLKITRLSGLRTVLSTRRTMLLRIRAKKSSCSTIVNNCNENEVNKLKFNCNSYKVNGIRQQSGSV